MALTFTIGGTNFTLLSTASAATSRQALAMIVKPGEYDNVVTHVKGNKGSYVVRGGLKQQEIVARCSYYDTLANVYAAYETDKAAWGGAAITIAEPGSASYTRCYLQHGGGIIKGPMALGRGNSKVRMDVEYNFISYAGKS